MGPFGQPRARTKKYADLQLRQLETRRKPWLVDVENFVCKNPTARPTCWTTLFDQVKAGMRIYDERNFRVRFVVWFEWILYEEGLALLTRPNM